MIPIISLPIQKFFKLEASAGIILFFAAILAVLIKNSPYSPYYDNLLAGSIPHWINDGLMAVFFFLVGMEIKREFVDGELSSKETALLPIVAACGGMIFPAVVYLIINSGNTEVIKGWAIPCATDIAFSLGILSLLGSRVKPALKVFLTALAIIDDLGAIVIIALFYTASLTPIYLLYSAACCIVLYILNLKNIASKLPYIIISMLLWYFVLKSGIHATIAGVLAAFFIPYRNDPGEQSTLLSLEHILHPYVAYFILPVFAFFNAGIGLNDVDLSVLFSHLTLGIALGLFLGKQIGVTLLSWISIKLKFTKLPAGASWGEFYGVAVLTGVGFTMSLFIDHLAFTDRSLEIPARVGIIAGSILSGVFGYLVIYLTSSRSLSK